MLVGRENELSLLRSLLGVDADADPIHPTVLVYGGGGAGKRLLVETALADVQPRCRVARIDCAELGGGGARLFFESALHQWQPGGEGARRCDNASDFVLRLAAAMDDAPAPRFLVLQSAERLLELDCQLLALATRLAQLAARPVAVLLLSRLSWDKFWAGGGATPIEPFCLPLARYHRSEVAAVLRHRLAEQAPDAEHLHLLENFVGLLLAVFGAVVTDVRELLHLGRLGWARYLAPVRSGQVQPCETQRLWRLLEPHLRTALDSVYLREVDSAQWLQQREATAAASASPTASKHYLELPFLTKFLLLAAYVASYNPASSDRRFFAKRSAKLSGRAKHAAKTAASSARRDRHKSHLLGPRPFPLDRLMAIFYAIAEDVVRPSAALCAQISSLVGLGLLAQVGAGDDCLAAPRYRCTASLETARALGVSVQFQLERHLYDFV